MASLKIERAKAALKNAFIGDALAMPVHWFYNPADIYKAFPLGIEQFEDAPTFHPSSIMSLHSTQQGGRANKASASQKEIVGEVILKGKRQYWGKDNVHYHQGMKAGENTLNAHCARIVLICALKGYDANEFLNQYINFMRADEPKHSDTYAESYHRGFFANLEQGIPAEKCGAVTHDTASIGAFVSVTPLAIVEAAKNTALNEIQQLCRKHLYLTHPDESLASVCDVYVELIYKLAHREHESPKDILDEVARNSAGLNLSSLMAKNKTYSFYETTKVFFKKLTQEEIEYYVDNYKPFDKAGSYGIQEWIGFVGIPKIEGDYFNVVGLPLNRLSEELRKF